MSEELITIAIYKEDWKILVSDMGKKENFRDKIHQLVKKGENVLKNESDA